MSEIWRDGEQVYVKPIYGEGRLGQIVILANVNFGKNPDFDRWPLAQYPQPSAFIIVEKVEGKDGYYVVVDGEGRRVTLRDEYCGASSSHLYDANEWLTWQSAKAKEDLASKEREIKVLEGHLALLKGILIEQGIRLLSKEAAEELGIA